MKIIKYNSSLKSEWDQFVNESKNGTFLLKRDYIEYHSDRFKDCSHLFYKKNKLIAVIPGNWNEKQKTFFSHQGLTYGSFILSYAVTIKEMLEIFDLFLLHLKNELKIETIIYRTIPWIYHSYPAEEDLYALFRYNATLIERKISSSIPLNNHLPFHRFRKRGIQKGLDYGLTIEESENMSEFWTVLTQVLHTHHQVSPVHTLEEISSLKKYFLNEIRLFQVHKDKEVIAGCVIYETRKTIHVQYIASNETGRQSGALDFLFNYLITDLYSSSDKYFDFGVSTEQGGRYLNEGLIFQKEGYGGRAVMYDTYKITI